MNRTELDEAMLCIKRGDEEAFGRLYEGTAKIVLSFLLSYTKNKAAAEDLMQDTYIKVRENIQSFIGGNPIPWILQIAKNLYLNYNKKGKKTVFTDFADDGGQYGKCEINTDTPVLNLVMTELGCEAAQIVLFYLVWGYKHREIADIVGKPLGTVLWIYNKSLKQIKQKLIEEDLL